MNSYKTLLNQKRCVAVCSLALLCAVLFSLLIPESVHAEGSKDLMETGGDRIYLDYRDDTTTTIPATGGIARRTLIYVYVQAGERLHLGSSAIGLGPEGKIIAVPPTGAPIYTFTGADGCGTISNATQETQGPALDGNPGYASCQIPALPSPLPMPWGGEGITPDQEGIWTIHFVSPQPDNDANDAGTSGTAWQYEDRSFVGAWDVTVSDSTNTVGYTGRAFTRYLALNMMDNDKSLQSQVYVQTRDGALYRVNLNGIDPFAAVFFSNNKGFRDTTGNAIYRSLQFVGNDSQDQFYGQMPPGYSFHNPADADTASDVTQKIFFNIPAATDLPASAPVWDVTTRTTRTVWLDPAYQMPTAPTDFAFTGVEGTPWQMGTPPLGGSFSFTNENTATTSSYTIIIDANGNGTYGVTEADKREDRILIGTSVAGLNTIFWDGLDGEKTMVQANTRVNAKLTLNTGEVHFPFFDAENHSAGFVIERLVPGSGNPYTIYYNDAYTPAPDGTLATFDYSLCAQGDTTTPLPFDTVDPPGRCYGVGSDPRATLLGIDSSTGAHTWTYDSGSTAQDGGFGNRRGIDTWTYVPSPPIVLTGTINIKQADLEIAKHIVGTPPVYAGETVSYQITVTNNGPSDIAQARVRDQLPAAIHDALWTCAVSNDTAGSMTNGCDEMQGSGSTLDTLVTLNNQAQVTLTITGTVSAADAAGQDIVNIATVTRPYDTTDPDLSNNTSEAVLPAPSPTPSPTATPTPPPSPSPSLTATPQPTISPTPSPSPTDMPTPSPSPTATESPIVQPSPSPSPSTTVTESPIVQPSPSPSPSPTATESPIVQPSPSTTVTESPIVQPSPSPSLTETPTTEPAPTETPTPEVADETPQVPTHPQITARKRDTLHTDVNHDGVVSGGDTLRYKITITNEGTGDATDVVFTDTPGSHTTLINGTVTSSQGTITRGNAAGDTSIQVQVGTLAARSEIEITYEVRIASRLPAGVREVRNQGRVTSNELNDIGDEVVTDDPDTSDSGDPTVTRLERATIAIDIKKRVHLAHIAPNQIVTYTIDITNTSSVHIFGAVIVTDTLDDGLTYIDGSAAPLQPDATGQVLIWRDATAGKGLASGETMRLVYQARVTTVPGVYLNTAVVVGEHPDGSVEDTERIPLTVEDPAVVMHKDVARVDTAQGIITFTIQITNTGPSVLDVVPLLDHFDGPIYYTGGVPPADKIDNKQQVIGWSDLTVHLGDMQPGQVFTIVTVFALTTGATPHISIDNTAYITSARDVYNNVVPDDHCSITTTVPIPDDPGEPTIIDLLSLSATIEGDRVVVRWTTAAEFETHGFALWRSANSTLEDAQQVSPHIILARGTASSGAAYVWTDTTAGNTGTPPTYWLEEIEHDGTRHMYGPTVARLRLADMQQVVFIPLVLN